MSALEFLRGSNEVANPSRPDLILLDLNLPRKDGRQVLEEIKTDPDLHSIPIIVLTTSKNADDIDQVYGLQANCYIYKPDDFEEYTQVVRTIENFWLNIVKLPLP